MESDWIPTRSPFIFDGQYSSDTADGHKGIGIGLSICRTIIHAHDGVIHAANLDKGADSPLPFQKKRRTQTMPKFTVLIIEDEKIFRPL